MIQFTIDVGILMSAAELGAPEHSVVCLEFMETLAAKDETGKVVWDDEGLIEYQYREKLKGSDYGKRWVSRMTDLDRIESTPRARIDRSVRIELLDKLHLDPEDYNYYVRTAAGSTDKLLVSHDPDYSKPVIRVLKKRLGIRLFQSKHGTELCQSH